MVRLLYLLALLHLYFSNGFHVSILSPACKHEQRYIDSI